jgi:hypothetical protein
MGRSRRALFALLAAAPALLWARIQPPIPSEPQLPPIPAPDEDDNRRLPNGKLQKNAIAKQEHQQALKDAENLLSLAQQLKSELQKDGDYVVSLSSVKKTEEIERLARKIRSRLKD